MFSCNHMKKAALAAAIATLSTATSAAVLEEIIVTAQKREQSLEDVPISLDVLGTEELNTKAVSDTADLALASPSLTLQTGFGPTSNNFVIRGIGTFALEGGIQPSVSFVVDGVPLSRVSEFMADLGDIERVEILRGPQGTLYGRNATGGAINIVRALPQDEFEAYIEQTVTDDEEYTTRGMLTGALNDRVRGRMAVYYKDREPHGTNYAPGVGDLGGEESYALMGKLDIDLSDNASLLLSADYRDTESGEGWQTIREVESDGVGGPLDMLGMARLLTLGNGDLALGKAIVADPFANGTSHPTLHKIENYGISADLTVDLSDDLTLKSITAYRSWENEARTDVDVSTASGTYNPYSLPAVGLMNTSLSPTGVDGTPITRQMDYISQELRLEGAEDGFEWIAGVYFNNHEEADQTEIPVVAASGAIPGGKGIIIDPRRGGAEWTSYAAFGDATIWLTDRINVFGGLRWTVEDLDVDVDRDAFLIPINLVPPGPGTYVLGDDFTFVNPAVAFQTADVKFTRSDRSEDWSGRLGLGWDVTENTNAYISASRGYVGAGSNYSRLATFQNSVINPSITESYEVGFKSQLLDNSVSLNGAIFTQTVDDLQTSRLIEGTINTETFNAGTLDTRGIELNVTWAATDLLTLDSAVTWLDTEINDLIQPCYPGQTAALGCNLVTPQGIQQDVSGNDMVLAPELSYNVSARLDFPLDSMPFTAYAMLVYTYQDDIAYSLTYDPKLVQSDYGLVDAFVGIEDKEGHYSVALFGKNLTDEFFDSSLSTAVGAQGRVLGRTTRNAQTYFGLKAKYTFY